MAQIIEFPRHPFLWKFTSSSNRVFAALRFLYNNFRTLPVQPRRMFIVYEMEDDEAVYYLNLGYNQGDLIDAVGEVIEDARKRPQNWEDDE